LFSSSFILFCIVATIARLLQDCCLLVCMYIHNLISFAKC
jgi:hypothetical protein